MTHNKITNTEAANDTHAPVILRSEKTARKKKPQDDDPLATLSIDDSNDFGGDPYNHTGSFYVPKFKDK